MKILPKLTKFIFIMTIFPLNGTWKVCKMPKNGQKVVIRPNEKKVVNGNFVKCKPGLGVFDKKGKTEEVFLYDWELKKCVFVEDSCFKGFEFSKVFGLKGMNERSLKDGKWDWKKKTGVADSLWALVEKMKHENVE